MKYWKFVDGRQKGCLYKKMCLWSFKLFNRIAFDAYILKYEDDTFLPLHRDPVEGKHWRLNIKLKGNSVFFVENEGSSTRKVVFFRPDLYLHSLTVHTKTIKLSFGFVKFDI